ncbi:MAG: hypothetical protein RSA97_09355, partial [Oscillospiraceae bacterium]
MTDYRQIGEAEGQTFANASHNAAVTDYRQSAAVPPLPCRITGKSAKRAGQTICKYLAECSRDAKQK